MQAYCIPLVSSYPPASSLPSGGPFNADPVLHCLDCLLSLLCIHPTLSWQSHLFYAPPESENVQSSKFTLISQIRAFRYSLQLPIGISHRRFKYFMHTISSFALFSSPPSPFPLTFGRSSCPIDCSISKYQFLSLYLSCLPPKHTTPPDVLSFNSFLDCTCNMPLKKI